MKKNIFLFVCLILSSLCFYHCTKSHDLLEGEFGSENHNDTSTIVELSDIIKALEENMVEIKGGTFTMGCTDEHGNECFTNEKPTHFVTLIDYSIGKYEVTFAEWNEITGEYPSSYTGCEKCPVNGISAEDITSFLDTLNHLTQKRYRLPTEAEWEYAARGGSTASSTLYAGSDEVNDVAWYNQNSPAGPQPVVEKQPNELGLYDMSGNVWEWCSDFYGEYTSEPKTNPTGPAPQGNQILRGGSFKDEAAITRIPRRNSSSPSTRSNHFGFRLALDK